MHKKSISSRTTLAISSGLSVVLRICLLYILCISLEVEKNVYSPNWLIVPNTKMQIMPCSKTAESKNAETIGKKRGHKHSQQKGDHSKTPRIVQKHKIVHI